MAYGNQMTEMLVKKAQELGILHAENGMPKKLRIHDRKVINEAYSLAYDGHKTPLKLFSVDEQFKEMFGAN